jgi:gamma-glutamyltranspeptidase / glutathione hydrolase
MGTTLPGTPAGASSAHATQPPQHESGSSPEVASRLQAIQRTPLGWHGGADPRREGMVMGD